MPLIVDELRFDEPNQEEVHAAIRDRDPPREILQPGEKFQCDVDDERCDAEIEKGVGGREFENLGDILPQGGRTLEARTRHRSFVFTISRAELWRTLFLDLRQFVASFLGNPPPKRKTK